MRFSQAVRMAVVVSAVVALAGCASVNMGKKFNDLTLVPGKSNVAHLNAKNWGIYVLSIPLITGNTDKSPYYPTFLKDTVNLDSVGDLLTREAKDNGAKSVTDLQSSTQSMWLGAPLFVLFYKSVQMSGNAVK